MNSLAQGGVENAWGTPALKGKWRKEAEPVKKTGKEGERGGREPEEGGPSEARQETSQERGLQWQRSREA